MQSMEGPPEMALLPPEPKAFARWGSGGIGNFYIRPEDLARRDFSKVMYYWDFS